MEASRLHIPHPVPRPHAAARPESWAVQLRWFAAAAAVGFAVPFIGSSLLGLQHDLYLGVYFVSVLGLCAAYAVATRLDVRATLARHWRLGVALGVLFGFALVRNVLAEDATPRPHGA
jgi:apolipoprotein N-acyltransferase